MNLGNLLLDLYRRQGFKTAPTTEVVTRFTAYLNQTQREILVQKGLGSLRFRVLPFASVAADPFATLPQAAVRVRSIADRTNQIYLTPTTLDGIRQQDPGLIATTAIPYSYAVVNLAAATFRDPTVTSLSFKSDSAADGATKEVFVEFITSTGLYQKTSALMNGVTAVDIVVDATGGVTKFYVTLAAGGLTTSVGNIKLYQAIGGVGTQISVIPPGQSYARYSRIQLFPTPSAAVTYHADVELHIEDMAEANDEPYLPEDFAYLLGSGAMMKEYQRKGDQIAYAIEKAMFKSGLGDLKLWVARASAASADPTPARHSMLGPNFPAGS